MIRLVSCGIERARDKEPILCAHRDAEQIYHSFQDHFLDFDNAHSVTLRDATAKSFQSAIQNAANSLKETDILVIYFSGHADSTAAGIKLLFYGGTKDTILPGSLQNETCESPCSKLLILDCCYAGEAVSLANYDNSEEKQFFVLSSVGSNSMAEHSESVSPFTQALIDCLDKLDDTDQAITLTSIQRALKKSGYRKSKLGISVGETDLTLKAAVSTAGSDEFSWAFWRKLPTLPSSMRAIMWYALDSSSLSFDTKIRTVEELWKSNHHFYEGSWIVRRAIGHLLGELPQYAPRVERFEAKLLGSQSWLDVCIGLVATRNQNTSKMQKKRREICESPEFPMDVIWLANLYYADHFSVRRDGEDGDEIFFPQQLCETVWGVEDLFARYKRHEDVLEQLEKTVNTCFRETIQTQIKMMDPENFQTENSLLSTYLKCPRRGRNTASYHDKWLRTVLFGQWRDHPMADDQLSGYFDGNKLEKCWRDLEGLNSATVDIKLGILSYVASMPPKKKMKYREALSWALEDPHPWVCRDAYALFQDEPERIKTTVFSKNIDRRQYPGVLDMIIEASTISRQHEWNTFLLEYLEEKDFNGDEINAIESYLK